MGYQQLLPIVATIMVQINIRKNLYQRIILNIKNNKDLINSVVLKTAMKWIHVNDHCLALIKIFKNGKIGENYNIGTGKIIFIG